MATNTTVLIVVTVLAALVLASVLVGVTYRTRTPRRRATDTTIRARHANGATVEPRPADG